MQVLRMKLPENIIEERIKMNTANIWERNEILQCLEE